jgi:hypothetical protein
MLRGIVASDTYLEKKDWMKKGIFLAMAALLAMLILVPMAVGQGPGNTTLVTTYQGPSAGSILLTTGTGPSAPGIPPSGGPDILLPAVALLLGSGILTYAILRRR